MIKVEAGLFKQESLKIGLAHPIPNYYGALVVVSDFPSGYICTLMARAYIWLVE